MEVRQNRTITNGRVGKRMGSRRVDVTGVGCGVVGGTGVCQLVGHKSGGASTIELKEPTIDCGSGDDVLLWGSVNQRRCTAGEA
jgi:hypothetical protein